MRAPPSLRTTLTLSLVGFGALLIAFNYFLLWRHDAMTPPTWNGSEHPHLQAAHRRVFHYALIEVGVVVLGTLALWLAWDRWITQRALCITDAARRMSAAEEPAPALPGRDEISRISRALHDAHLRLNQQAAALRASEERYRRMVEVLPSIVLVNRHDRFEYVNPAGVALMRTGTAENFLGRSVFDLVHPDYHHAVRERIRLMREGGNVPVQEQIFIRADGEPLHVEVASSTFVDERGPAIQVVAYDITARKAAEERREALTRQLAEKNKELETLLYVASHDLRSPLVNIQGFSRMLEREWQEAPAAFQASQCPAAHEWLEKSTPRIQRALDYITGSVRRIDALLEGLLRVSRLGRSALEIQAVDPAPLVGEVLRSLHYQIEEKGATVTVEEPLPACRADAHMLTHVFSNLIDNAIKHGAADGPPVVTVRGRREGAIVAYDVQDTGPGIPPDQQQRVFEMFQRGQSGSESGQGLGLTLAQRCAERIGGRVRLRSEEGRGSCFTIELPAA